MKEQALALVRGLPDPGQALNRLREYLQTLVRRSFHEGEAFRPLAFAGGTALRFLHGLPRFSEGLDFSVVSAEGCDAHDWKALVRPRLSAFDLEAIGDDVRPFLECPEDAGLLTRDNLLGLLRSARGVGEERP